MSLHSNTLSLWRVNQSLLLLLKSACLAEQQQLPILSLVWPKPGLKPYVTYEVQNIRCNFHIQLLFWLAYSLQVWEIMTFILVYDQLLQVWDIMTFILVYNQLLQKIYKYTLVFRVTWSLVLCVCLVDCCLSFCTFSFGHCLVYSSYIYGFWLPPFGIFKLFLYHLH